MQVGGAVAMHACSDEWAIIIIVYMHSLAKMGLDSFFEPMYGHVHVSLL